MNPKRNLDTLLQRTSLSTPFSEFINQLEQSFRPLGKITHYLPILEGYEDANIKLETTTGTYALKIFSKERTTDEVSSYIKILEELPKIDVPTMRLIAKNSKTEPHFIISKFFFGKNFQDIPPSIKDMTKIAGWVSKINTLDFPVVGTYDSWGIKNLSKEYEKNKDSFSLQQMKLIEPIFKKYSQIDLDSLPKSVIHGDMQKKHVLKNDKNQYCIIDFGCAAYDARIIDLCTYLAWFCFDPENWNRRQEIAKFVLAEYQNLQKLTDVELKSVPILTMSSYAAYFQKTSILIRNGDLSEETKEWHDMAQKMLELFQGWEWKIV